MERRGAAADAHADAHSCKTCNKALKMGNYTAHNGEYFCEPQLVVANSGAAEARAPAAATSKPS